MSRDALDRLLASRPAQLVRGHFDPLLAEHARILADAAVPGKLLAVIVTNPPHPLLVARARAELVAGLAIVDYVAIADGEGDSAGDFPDVDITRRFMEQVRLKHQEPGA